MSQVSEAFCVPRLGLATLMVLIAACGSTHEQPSGPVDASVPRSSAAPVLDDPRPAGRGGEAPQPDASTAAAADSGTGAAGRAGTTVTKGFPPRPPLLTTHFALRNDSDRAIWHGGSSGCDDRWLSVHPAEPQHPNAAENSALEQARTENGCLCRCEDLSASEVCARGKCPESFGCTAAIWSAPIAPGQALEADLTLTFTQFAIEQKCVMTRGYFAGTELIATFCFSYAENQAYECHDVRFRAGDASVKYVASSVDQDAGS